MISLRLRLTLTFITFLILLAATLEIKDKKTLQKYTDIPYSGYDYDRENPNALHTGPVVAGTVYADPAQNPGLGWIL